MSSNFSFLNEYWPALCQIGHTAEQYLYSDPNACIYKLGMFGERLVLEIFRFEKLEEPTYDNNHANRIRLLKREGLLPKKIDDLLYSLRMARNDAVHNGEGTIEQAQILLHMAYNLSVWFMEVYGDWSFVPATYVMLADESCQSGYNEIIKEAEKKIADLPSQVTLVTTAASSTKISDRGAKSEAAAEHIELSEAETRYLIDEQLRKVGWEADTPNLRYSKGTRPEKGRNIAIAEWPTSAAIKTSGYADYALFAGLKLVGIMEAKRGVIDIPSVIDYQCKEYARSIKAEHSDYCLGNWNGYSVPFVFATNGRKYLKQFEIKSGIWFLDLRQTSNIPKALQGWMSPGGMLELLAKDAHAANAKLASTTYDLLRDPDGLNLRPYQIRAIEAAEKAVVSGQPTALLSMATGTGKTRTVLGMIYRFLKTGRFKRILFLVDRTALGEQAQDVFKEVKLEELMTLDDIYNIQGLDDANVEKETKLHVATVQSMVKRLLYNDETSIPAVTDYDLIVVDEAHRGYLLDKEMGEDEQLYRNQDDYVSKYRTVIEYFDAVKIALTATPALQTAQIFGKPVFNYSYREAVIDGYLVDHDAPHELHTKLRDEGIRYGKGEQMALYDPLTGELINSEALEDEVVFDVDAFNRKVITENFNRTVLTEIANDINPEGLGKTLIYAADDQHADLIVKLLKEIYEPYGIDNEAVMKITGSVGGGNKKLVLKAIKRFKNEEYPSIVVTVDLLTTGIDVPEITTLVFLRRVRSRILFEQMLGRATRLCPRIQKTHFEIYDPVGVYESLLPVSTMRPAVENPSASFEDLLNGLDASPDEKIEYQINLIVAKLQRRRRALGVKELEQFLHLSGGKDPAQFLQTIREMPVAEAKAHLLGKTELFRLLDQGGPPQKRRLVIDHHEDTLVSHTRGYGAGQRPEDYLESFRAFITNNLNTIAALHTVCTRPSELTREALKGLKLELDRHNFTEQQLNSAISSLKNEEIAADIISIIRQQALGSPLISHAQRIRNAVAKLKQSHNFNKLQIDWLTRIEKALLSETVLDEQSFEMGAFKVEGGFRKMDQRFDGKLKELLTELTTYLYDDGGKTA